MNQTLRIACYGIVNKNSGSVAGAGFLILEELLERGFQIDFYGFKDYIYPQELLKYKNFHYIAVPRKSPLVRSFLRTLPKQLKKAVHPLAYSLFFNRSNKKAVRETILDNYQTRKYSLLLVLGLYSPLRVEDIPVISWVQGPPKTEWYFIHKHRKTLISLCGIGLYIKLRIFYVFKAIWARSETRNSDILICGSQWSKEQLVIYGVKPEAIKVLPYPIDTSLFKLNDFPKDKKEDDSKVFLWLGRIDLRKRLDLLLEAYRLVLQERQDVKLKIFGGFSYAKDLKKLIDRFEFPEYLEYQPSIDRSQVPELMAQCDILIQPSEGENFGSSVVEALCCGLPVIVGPTNGTKDYISPSSWVFEHYEPQSLKNAMLQAIEAIEQDREKLALEARQTAEENFSVSRVVDRLEDIFQETLGLQRR